MAVVGFWLVALLALVGAFTGLARRAPRWLWLTPLLLYLSVVFVNAETPRFRAPIDPFLIMLAALRAGRRGLDAARARLDARAPVGRDELAAPVTGGARQLVEMVQRGA